MTLQNVTLSGNTAKNGGGVFNKLAGTTLSNVTVAATQPRPRAAACGRTIG